MIRRVGCLLAVGLVVLAGCQGPGKSPARSATAGSATSTPASPPPTSGASGSPSRSAGSLAGAVVVLDAGHNDGNFGHPDQIGRMVEAGGFRKPCDTTGTETADGYTEATFTFDVTRRLSALLRAAGAKVVLTRTDDHSVGPCVDERAKIGNRAHADVALQIHADGGPPSGHGFHVMEPTRGAGHHDEIVAPSRRLAVAVRDAYQHGTGMPPATYIGAHGLNPRSDMAGLNLSTVPKVLVECGNMRNSHDAKLLKSGSFRQRIAKSLAAAVVAFQRADD